MCGGNSSEFSMYCHHTHLMELQILSICVYESSAVPDPVSESESKVLARLCILKDWVSLEFIRASLVTYKIWEMIKQGEEEKEKQQLVPLSNFWGN